MRRLLSGMVLTGSIVAIGMLPSVAAAPKVDGKAVYTAHCARCHQADGQGLPGKVPPLAGSDYLNRMDLKRVGIVLNGLRTSRHPLRSWPYDQQMKPFKPVLNDAQIAAVITYASRAWGNRGRTITERQVKEYRHVQETGPAAEMWREAPNGRRQRGMR